MTKKKYFVQRDLKDCSCGHNKFETIVKGRVYGCRECNKVKIVVLPSTLTGSDDYAIAGYKLRKKEAAAHDHKVATEKAIKAEVKKKKKKKPKRKFWTPKFLRKKQKLSPVVTPYPSPAKTKKMGEKI